MPIADDDPRLAKCGFAKLQGDGFEFFMRKYEIGLGRKSKSNSLDVVLGDHMNISRKHACIRYNFDKGIFELEVLGKNGVTIRGVLHTPASPPMELRSRDLIQMGDKSFYFLLPKDASRLGPPPKQRRTSQNQYATGHTTPSNANGSNYDPIPTPTLSGAPMCSDPHLGMGRYRHDHVDPHLSLGQGVGDYGGKSDGLGGVDEVQGSGKKRKTPELGSDAQELVFTHPSPMGVQGAHLYRPGSLA
ncbi:hypothetical protein BSKO_07884 [Bryopsis sp. KO-2023]|nr:hypothetical protein BSKO_07884 [Bryopsis sp. KO-2023]